ncbi:MAG: molybdenum cofactor guanylyltransferase [Rhodospirillaceae bacterium]
MDDRTPLNPTFGALILAGGRSSRMGTDKASLPYRGVTLLQHMRALQATAGAEPILIAGGPDATLPDPVPFAGPVSGLCALTRFFVDSVRRWIVVPVDMPLLRPKLLQRLAAAQCGAVSFKDHPLPLALTMDNSAQAILQRAEEKLRAGESVAIHQVLVELEAQFLCPDPEESAQLVNANTPEDWARMTRED